MATVLSILRVRVTVIRKRTTNGVIVADAGVVVGADVAVGAAVAVDAPVVAVVSTAATTVKVTKVALKIGVKLLTIIQPTGVGLLTA